MSTTTTPTPSAAAMQLSHLSLKYTHPAASCGYTTSHLSLEYAHYAQPAARCGGYMAISLFTSSDLAASFSTTGVRPSHTSLRPAVVAVPPSPALSYSWSTTITLASRPTPLPLRYTAFSPLSRMSITQSTPTTINLFTSCGYAAISPPSPGTCPLRSCSSPLSYQYVAFSITPDSPSRPSYQIWPHGAGVCGSYQLWLHPWLCPLGPDNCFPRHPFVWFPIITPSKFLHSMPFRLAVSCGYVVIFLTLHHAHHI